jgi:FemAB-related protein (PEP-CTERM system-associated)
MKPTPIVSTSLEGASWPEKLLQSGGFSGLNSWTQFVESVYGSPTYRLVSQTEDELRGFLSLTHIKHPFFGDYLVTAPFASYGGFAFSSLDSRQELLDQARLLGDELRVGYVNIRFDAGGEKVPEGWVQHPVYATYCAELTGEPENMLQSYSSDHRNHIRKSLRKGFSIRFGHLDLLDDVYQGLSRSMHELGSPYHNKLYLQRMAESLGNTLEFAVVYAIRGELAGAGVFIRQGQVVTNLHANILRHFRSDYAGEYLYWSVISTYARRGFKVFDMGRSLIGSGNETFKLKWKPKKRSLAYWYALRPGTGIPELNQKNPRFQIAIWTWKHLPAALTRTLGPSLIKGLA